MMEDQKIIGIIVTFGISMFYLSVCVVSSTELSLEPPIANKTEGLRIVGGQYAKLGQFPWMAVVYNGYSHCGGSIISRRWVLTAAHCLHRRNRLLVILGEVNKRYMNGWYYSGQGVAMISVRAVPNPWYGSNMNDIGLLEMPRDIKFNDYVQPIALPGRNYYGRLFTGETAIIVGWGYVGQGYITQDLKWAKISVISNERCGYYWQVDESQICTAARTRVGTCGGDSGGPLILGTQWGSVAIGIVSYGDQYCPSSTPSVFTRVSSFLPWIQRITGETF